jgi:ABC-type oligopeptide transport system ATPase subunit
MTESRHYALGQRVLIIGNSGSGKTTLARQLADATGGLHIDLDTVYWQDQTGLKKRVEPAAKQMVAELSQQPHWVIEGVYGWLVQVAAPRATALVWLNLPWAECKAGLEARGPGYSPSQAEYDALLAWAERYWTRDTPSSEAGHRKLFDAFSGYKLALSNRADLAALVGRSARVEQS